jgi:hypothetical protein
MIERNHPSLSVGMQCRLLSLSRSSFYYEPQGETGINLALMLLIDKQFLDTPFYGVQHLKNEGHPVNVKRIRRLMRLMRLMPIFEKPDTSRPAKGHRPTPICSAACGWIGPTRSGAPTSPICRCGVAFCIWSRSWTGSPARCWHGASPTRRRRTSVSRR